MFFEPKRPWAMPPLGLLLPAIIGCSAGQPTRTGTVVAVNAPKIVEEAIALSPTVTANVKKVQFFEGERSKRAFAAERKYESRFAMKDDQIHIHGSRARLSAARKPRVFSCNPLFSAQRKRAPNRRSRNPYRTGLDFVQPCDRRGRFRTWKMADR